jgi:nucleoside-diphosphate-sugar epimerase
MDGIGLRLPTICVRPGKPNLAASGFFSSIIREPLAGQEAVLPVSRDVVHTHASPRSAIGFLVHAAGLDSEKSVPRRNMSLPGVAVSVGEQIEALRRVAGDDAVALIREEPDPAIAAIVDFWPHSLRGHARARSSALRCRDLVRRHHPHLISRMS